jgi:ergothioneine biosynthesis protein EgtB
MMRHQLPLDRPFCWLQAANGEDAMEASRAQFFTQPAANNAMKRRYHEIRTTTLKLAQPYSVEDQMLQSMPDASPLKWHLAHTTWFFETFILSALSPGYKPFHPGFKHLFNSYYKQLGSHPYRGSRGLMSRPSLDEVYGYRKRVDDAMDQYLEYARGDVLAMIELGLNHEQQHQELILTDIKHALWSMPLRPEHAHGLRAVASLVPLEWGDFEEGIYDIGHSGEGFAFDNEGPRHRVLLRPFQIASRQVTNAEYLEFMQDDGYRRPELWLSDGWDAVCADGWNSPLYWEHQDGGWREFSFRGMQEMDFRAPVCHISYYEAEAFARWRGARLPREEEWEVAAMKSSPAHHGEFQESGSFHPQPANGTGPQWFGNVWEWTASPYVAYPEFKPAAGIIGEYNGKFMCNQFVLRGGSCATPAHHVRATYRNFFPPQARWQFMGIRLAK